MGLQSRVWSLDVKLMTVGLYESLSNRGSEMTYTSYPAHPTKLLEAISKPSRDRSKLSILSGQRRILKPALVLSLTSFTLTIPCSLCQESNSRSAPQQQAEKLNPSTGSAAPGASSTPAKTNTSYVIGPGDLLAINVLHEPEVSQKVPVRMDGKITMPLIGEIQASGMVPDALQATIAQKLHDYIKDAEVTVVVEEMKGQEFSVMGEVEHPGSFPLTKPTTVLAGLAQAGGFRDFAKVSKIHVLRKTPQGTTITLPFNYKQVSKGKDDSQNIELRPGDTIIVP